MSRVAYPSVVVSLILLTLIGCKSSTQEGVSTNGRTQWTTVSGDVAKVTAAAESVLKEYNLKDVESHATTLDGSAKGSKADGTSISVLVRKATAGCEVTVNVGTLGDPKLGAEIAKKIKDKAEAA